MKRRYTLKRTRFTRSLWLLWWAERRRTRDTARLGDGIADFRRRLEARERLT